MIEFTKKEGAKVIKYKINILSELKKAGYNTSRIRKENILGEQTLQKIRRGIVVYGTTLDKLCELLNCQPGDLLEYKNANPEPEPETEQHLEVDK